MTVTTQSAHHFVKSFCILPSLQQVDVLDYFVSSVIVINLSYCLQKLFSIAENFLKQTSHK